MVKNQNEHNRLKSKIPQYSIYTCFLIKLLELSHTASNQSKTNLRLICVITRLKYLWRLFYHKGPNMMETFSMKKKNTQKL